MGMPSLNTIVKYWEAEYEAGRPTPWLPTFEWHEPECMACGYLAESWGNKDWSKAKLDRCHIIPRAFGGSDEPSNLVLMCKRCHEDSPDCADPQILIKWMKDKPRLILGKFTPETWKSIWESLDQLVADRPKITGTDFAKALDLQLPKFSDHFGTLSQGTWLAVMDAACASARDLVESGEA